MKSVVFCAKRENRGAFCVTRFFGLASLLAFTAMITINLGVFNLLPLPALDGGRVLFLLIELLRRKPVPPEKEGMVHFVGLALLMILILVVTAGDIYKLING